MRGSCTPSGGWAVRSTVGRRTSSRWSDRGSRDRSRLGRRTRDETRRALEPFVRSEGEFAEADRERKKGLLFPEELRRLEGRERGGAVLIFRLPEPQELRIPKSGREARDAGKSGPTLHARGPRVEP